VIVIAGGLIYFPMLILGPIGERGMTGGIPGRPALLHNGGQAQ
jgi:hypothetical protein